MAESRICSVENCDNPVKTRGWCGKHYMRWYQHGDPTKKLNRYGDAEKFIQQIVAASHTDDCIIWPFDRAPKGYGRYRMDGRRVGAHRVVCEAVNGPPPSEDHVCAHSCGQGHLGCVNPRHLRWATQKENHADKTIHGTIARGSRNGNAKMDEQTAKMVKEMIPKMTQREIAERLGITRSAVRDLKIGKTWGWIA